MENALAETRYKHAKEIFFCYILTVLLTVQGVQRNRRFLMEQMEKSFSTTTTTTTITTTDTIKHAAGRSWQIKENKSSW